MWTIIFGITALICLACVILGAYLAGRQKGRKEKEIGDLSFGLLLIGGIILVLAIGILWTITYTGALRYHLNEPITSEMQLYGYKILDKRYFKEKPSANAPEKSRYLIDIQNILIPYRIFHNVEVSEEIFPKLIKGTSYLPENDPNAPALTRPITPNCSKAKGRNERFGFSLFQK